nr:homologous-pairing protein 2 homolog [Aedes albopictus]
MSSSDSTKAAILKLLDEQQRPFSLSDISEKVKELGKSTVQKALDSLVRRGKIIEKVYGKQRIYCIAQEDEGPEHAELGRKLDVDCARLREELTQRQQQIRSLEASLATASSQMTVGEALEEIETLEGEIRRVERELEEEQVQASTSHAAVTAEQPMDKDALEKKYNLYLSAYRKRKRICTEMIEHIMEGYPKSKQHLLEDIGVETDEAVGWRLAEN